LHRRALNNVVGKSPHEKAKEGKLLLNEHDASGTEEVGHNPSHKEDPNDVAGQRRQTLEQSSGAAVLPNRAYEYSNSLYRFI
jgi:hypothetical protein